jgi:uncharacterized protein YbjT (DUF2867 family)
VILVTGATGNVGRHVVAEMLPTAAPIRALTRDPEAAHLPDGVDVVPGDLSHPETIGAAMDGVDAVFLLWPFLRIDADAAAPALDVIREHAHRVVFLSSLAVRDELNEQASANTAFHADVEKAIEQSGMEWTFLRSAGIATNTRMWAPQIRAGGVLRWPYGAARRSLIHERDLAAVARHALTEDGHRAKRYVVTGPEALTQVEQLDAIGEAIARPLRWEEIPADEARAQLQGQLPPELVNGILDAHAGFVTDAEPVTHTVAEVTGRPARTFSQWAADHADDFL